MAEFTLPVPLGLGRTRSQTLPDSGLLGRGATPGPIGLALPPQPLPAPAAAPKPPPPHCWTANPRIRLVSGFHHPRLPPVTRPRFRRVSKQLVGAELVGAGSPVVIGPVGQTTRVSKQLVGAGSPVVIGPVGQTTHIQVTVGATATFRVEGGVGELDHVPQ